VVIRYSPKPGFCMIGKNLGPFARVCQGGNRLGETPIARQRMRPPARWPVSPRMARVRSATRAECEGGHRPRPTGHDVHDRAHVAGQARRGGRRRMQKPFIADLVKQGPEGWPRRIVRQLCKRAATRVACPGQVASAPLHARAAYRCHGERRRSACAATAVVRRWRRRSAPPVPVQVGRSARVSGCT